MLIKGTYRDSCGWLIKSGDFYICKPYEHDKLQEEMESKNLFLWAVRINLQAKIGFPFCFAYTRRISKSQVTFIWDYCQYHGVEYPKIFIDSFS